MGDFVDGLTDAELRTKLCEFGFPVVPITATTRKVMAKKLKLLIENKNKVNSEGRRSLAKYSSEEESDSEVKIKKDKSRRVTVAAVMQPPTSTSKPGRKSTRFVPKEDPDLPAPSTTSTVSNTEVKTTRRTTRYIKPVIEADFETGSDSEPEITEYINSSTGGDKETKSSSFTSYGISPLSPRVSLSQSTVSENNKSPVKDYVKPATEYSSPKPITEYSSPKPVTSTSSSYTSRYTSFAHSNNESEDSLDKLNQIRSRLSLGTSYERPTFGTSTDRKVIGTSYGEGDAPIETPFLSNFTRRLSQLSNSPPSKTDYNYKNDIIKEHDANGSSAYNRLYLARNKKRDYPPDFKSSQEKNIFKNNVVSLALIGLACAFFVVIFLMYIGIRTEQLPAVMDTDYFLPACADNDYHSKPGINCLVQGEITDALNLFKVLLPELTKRSLSFHCSDSKVLPYMTDDHIMDHVAKNYAPRDPYQIQKDINNLQVLIFKNPKWGISIILKDSFPNDIQTMDNMDQVLNNKDSKNLALMLLNPEIPWKCFIFNKLYTILSSVFIVGLGFSMIYAVQRGYKYFLLQRKAKNDQIYSMVEKIIDILQTNVTDNADNFLAVNHVRDMIIPPQDRKQLSSIWDSAVKFLEENESRVRTEVQIVSGEEFHVWRWLGSANLNMSGSKIWQGQAFETQVGSVNSLPCSPTPCLKVRGFDERERNQFTIREAVLSKCASQCKILHCDVDSNSNCVYLKCANQNEAAIAYRNLHGWWYDGHLLTVKYLRLERYMQRFPDSPPKGPPFLQASTNASVNNDWSNKDD